MEYAEKKHNRSGLLATLLVHAILFVIFIFVGLKIPVPLPDTSTQIVMNFGNSADGMGPVQPKVSSVAATQQEQENSQQTAPAQPVPSDVVTQKTESPVSAPTTPEQKTTPQPESKPEPKPNPDALFKRNTSSGGGGSEGETGLPGDQGDPSGDRNSGSRIGSAGDGSGNNFSLGNRKALHKPTRKPDCQETGKIVVDITVNRAGKVVRATPGGRGTINPAPCLLDLAKALALETTWEPDPNAPEVQAGTIVYNITY